MANLSLISDKKRQFEDLVCRFEGWQGLTLPDLLTLVGNDSKVARILSVDDKPVNGRTVSSWRTLERAPRTGTQALLYVLSDGVLTPNKILSPFIEKKIKELTGG
ncbi:MAG: hypothetical protein CMB99_16285 [Flavobacteriaceae bacterium]|nr:hypothetical protein [Flavobacteriaceae bacterium]|tara:strand:- start:6635 stop:6949 length:315 start_codon:yes stop_codon:yes gene_type:complete